MSLNIRDYSPIHMYNAPVEETFADVTTTDDLTVGDDATIAGDLAVTGGVAVNTNKFTVAAASGNTVVAGTLDVTGASTFTAGLKTKQAVNNVHDTTPTAAELTTSFGDPATLGRGFIGTVDDNDGDAIGYIVWVSDASFYFVKGTKAS